MAMQINGNQDRFAVDYAERLKEKRDVPGTKQAKEAEKAAEGKNSGRLSEPQDEYISSEKSGQKPTGLYRIGQDENGSQKIFFDDPKAAHAKEEEDLKAVEERSGESADGREPKVGGDSQGKPAEVCVGNTDKVDQEIKKLKEKQQELEQQIRSASGDEKKVKELERKLEQVEQELTQKDNDAYRRQHTVFSGAK